VQRTVFSCRSADEAPLARHKETTMEKKPLFRRMLDSMIEGRARQAQRYVDEYVRAHGDAARRG